MHWKLSYCIKMSKQTPKNPKNWHNTHVVLCWHRNFFESNKRQWISFLPQRWGIPYRNHHACCEKLWFVRGMYPNLPQMGQKLYHGMLISLHDSMPSSMNFRRVLHLLEFKNQVSQRLRSSDDGGGCLTFIPISCMGPKHAPKVKDLIFQPMYMHRSMCI